MKKKYLAAVILIFAVALALIGCGGKDKKESSESTKVQETTQAPDNTPTNTPVNTPASTPTPTVTPSPTPTPVPPVVHDGHEKKRELSCLTDKGMVLDIHDAGEDRMLVSVFTREMCYDADGLEAGTKVRYCIVDTKNDAIVTEAVSESAAETFVGLRENGDIIVYDSVFKRILVYSKELKLVKELPLDVNENIIYDSEKDVLYTIRGAKLISFDMEGNEKVLLEKTVETDILGSSYNCDTLFFSDPGYNSIYERVYSLYDVVSGKVVSSDNHELTNGLRCDDYFVGLSATENREGLIMTYDLENKKEGSAYKYAEKLYKCCDTGCRTAVLYTEHADEKNNVIKDVILVKPEDGRYEELESFSSFDVAVAEDVETEHLYFVVTTYPAGRPVNSFFELCPECFDFSKKLETAEAPEIDEDAGIKCGEYLSDVRKKADEIEKEYGVEILIGDEIKQRNITDTYNLVSTEDSYEWDRKEELVFYDFALEYLETALKKYPEGFFDMFKDYRNVGGMRFALVADLESKEGSFVAGGVSSDIGCWRNIVFDIDVMSESTPHHEIWHSVESQIRLRDPDAFSDETWGALNPEGFKYVRNFDYYLVDSMKYDEYILMRSFGETPGYFIEAYSTVNGQEDRATLIEPVMTDDITIYDAEKYSSSRAYVETFPALNAKLEYMEKQYEKWFGEKYW